MTRPNEIAQSVDVATSGDPALAVAAVAQKWADGGHVVRATVAHDPGCPCITGRPITACTCEIVRVTGRRLA